jgi:hypothetical protein
MRCRYCHFPHGKDEKKYEKYHLLEKISNKLLAAPLASCWFTG